MGQGIRNLWTHMDGNDGKSNSVSYGRNDYSAVE